MEDIIADPTSLNAYIRKQVTELNTPDADLEITENNITELVTEISQKHDLLAEKVNKEEQDIKEFFLARIKVIIAALKKRVLTKPANLEEYFKIWLGVLPLVSIAHFTENKKAKDPVEVLQNMNLEFINSLFETVFKDEEIVTWFLKNYVVENIDILILFLKFLLKEKRETKQVVQMLIDLPNPEGVKKALFFDYSNSLAEMQKAMFEEMMEAEGEDDSLDEEDIQLPPVVGTPEEVNALQEYCKTAFQELWDETLRSHAIDADTIILILRSMNTQILPKVSKPILFSDFIIGAYNIVDNVVGKLDHKKIVLSIHALSSLFVLLTNHGLDYTSINFYEKLYRLLEYLENIFRMKEKEKFLRLMELSIKSPMLPASIAASFMKKLLRIILNKHMAQASLTIWAISFVCNVIKKHPVLTKMINVEVQRKSNRLQRIEERKERKRDRKARVKISKEKHNPSLQGFITKDVFDMNEKDPQKSRALETCLWEILPFFNHSSKLVRDYACVISTDFQQKRSLPSEELAKLDETQLIKSQIDEISKIRSIKSQMVRHITDIYSGYDVEGERKFQAYKEKHLREQIELFHLEKSLLTRQF
ncbi:unnamed protein product [Moneuplotes crassus]|uniref:CCAAT-binding factor domain-containing protein n=1 Tax=Euplotes crassus TaxID=5936 RepID=A0AAD1U6W6_EUPCR|nr:unnamed protein product [Moneuplotes crassus]